MPNSSALNESSLLTIFPNLVTSKTQIQFVSQSMGLVEIDILNSMGKIINHEIHNVTGKMEKQLVELDLSKLSAGVYRSDKK